MGDEIEKGLLPDDDELIGTMIRRICFDNSAEYLALPTVVDSRPFAPAEQRS
jgi:hypothetical protein